MLSGFGRVYFWVIISVTCGLIIQFTHGLVSVLRVVAVSLCYYCILFCTADWLINVFGFGRVYFWVIISVTCGIIIHFTHGLVSVCA